MGEDERTGGSHPHRLALVPISLDVRVDRKTGMPPPPILLPSADGGGGEVRLSKADVSRVFVQNGDKLGFVSREHVLIRVEPSAGNDGRARVIVRSLATNQVSIRRGAHAEAYEVAPYSLTLLTKNEEAELYVGDHLQLLNPPFERLGCHALTLQLTILPTAADPAQEAAEHEQGASSATQAAAASSEAAPAKTLRQGSGLIARPPVPLFFPPLTAEGAGGSGRIAASGTDDEQDHEEEDEDEERDEEPSLSERGLAAVFASPPLVGVAGAMRPPSQTSLLGVGRKQQGGAQPTPALPPLPPPAQETLPKGRRPRAEESDGGEGEGEEEEGGAMGGMAKRARPAEQEQEAAVAMDVAEAENKKRRGSLGDALMAPLGGWISSLFTSGSKRAAGRAIDDDQQLGSKKRRTTTAAMEEEEAVVPE